MCNQKQRGFLPHLLHVVLPSAATGAQVDCPPSGVFIFSSLFHNFMNSRMTWVIWDVQISLDSHPRLWYRVWLSWIRAMFPHSISSLPPSLPLPSFPSPSHPAPSSSSQQIAYLRRFVVPQKSVSDKLPSSRIVQSIHYELPPSLKCLSVMLLQMRRAGKWRGCKGEEIRYHMDLWVITPILTHIHMHISNSRYTL